MSTVTIYGIKACDTMKKAMTWLDEQGIDYTFHDYKKVGIQREKLQEWLNSTPWTDLINRRGTTWRKVPEERKTDLDNDRAVELMLENQSMIKRPILEMDGKIKLGFKADEYAKIFAS